MPTMTQTYVPALSQKANWLLSNRRNKYCSRRPHCNYSPLWSIWITGLVRCRSKVTSNVSHWNWRSGPAAPSENQQLNQKRPASTGLFFIWLKVLLDLQDLERDLTRGGFCFNHIPNFMVHEARPMGDSLDIFPLRGSASFAPTK